MKVENQLKLALIAMLSNSGTKLLSVSRYPELLDVSCNASPKQMIYSGKVQYIIEIYKKPKNARRKKSKK